MAALYATRATPSLPRAGTRSTRQSVKLGIALGSFCLRFMRRDWIVDHGALHVTRGTAFTYLPGTARPCQATTNRKPKST